MPGYHGKTIQPEMHMMYHPRPKESMYPRHYPQGKMIPMGHPMFDAQRSRYALHDKGDYGYMIKSSKMGGDGGYPTFDSLKLLGSENDAGYLDAFMSNNNDTLKHRRYPSDDNDIRPRARSCSQNKNSNNVPNQTQSKRNSFNVDSLKKTILGSLRSAASDENIYESVEVIQYRKTIEAIKRQKKEKTVSKTGHPLFDHLRVERVLNSDRGHHHHSRQNSHTSDGGSNSQSSSGSGDEFDTARKPRFSRREVLGASKEVKKTSINAQESTARKSHAHKNHKRDSRPHMAEEGSESDDDWAIPRPKICGNGRTRRTGATGLVANGSHDESDSSSKSTGLR